MTKKNAAKIAADDAAIIASATHFVVTMHKGAKNRIVEERPTLAEAQALRDELIAANPKHGALISAVNAEGRQAPLWNGGALGTNGAATKAIADLAPAKKGKPAKAAKAAKAKAPAKAAKKAADGRARHAAGSKSEKVLAMLAKAKYTPKAIREAVEWPSCNIKAIAARKGLKLSIDGEGIISAR